MLDYADFESGDDSDIPEFFGIDKPEHAVYAVQMARLAQLRKTPEITASHHFAHLYVKLVGL
jgi:hypothetical protein